jgi:hypothetical protein
LGFLVPAEIDHSNIRLVRYLDSNCKLKFLSIETQALLLWILNVFKTWTIPNFIILNPALENYFKSKFVAQNVIELKKQISPLIVLHTQLFKRPKSCEEIIDSVSI